MSWIEELNATDRLELERLKLDAAKAVGPEAVRQWLRSVMDGSPSRAEEAASAAPPLPTPATSPKKRKPHPHHAAGWLLTPEVRAFIDERLGSVSDSRIARDVLAKFGQLPGTEQVQISKYRRSKGIAPANSQVGRRVGVHPDYRQLGVFNALLAFWQPDLKARGFIERRGTIRADLPYVIQAMLNAGGELLDEPPLVLPEGTFLKYRHRL
jgi:hypothetical protein